VSNRSIWRINRLTEIYVDCTIHRSHNLITLNADGPLRLPAGHALPLAAGLGPLRDAASNIWAWALPVSIGIGVVRYRALILMALRSAKGGGSERERRGIRVARIGGVEAR
jgi:hypothetical protein